MAIEVEGKTYRNLPEQVEENANNIQWLLETIRNFGNVMRYCGSVATYDDLPTEDNKIGDVWNVLDTGNNYAWDGEGWDEISSIVDLSGYVTKINSPLPEYQFNTENIISTIEQYGLENKNIIVNTPNHRMIVYISKRFNTYLVNGYELGMNAYIGFQVQPTSIWDMIPTQNVVVDYQLENFSKRYIGTYVGNEIEFNTQMNVGDIIVESTGGQFLINEIAFDSDNNLTKVILVGLEDNGNPVVHKFENGTWSSSNYVDNAISSINSGLMNVINASGIGSDGTLSIEDYAKATNGKPTRIEGTILNWNGALLLPMNETTSTYYGIVYLKQSYNRQRLFAEYQIIKSTRKLSYDTSASVLWENSRELKFTSLNAINGKTIPAYPASTGTFVLKCVNGTLTWVQE